MFTKLNHGVLVGVGHIYAYSNSELNLKFAAKVAEVRAIEGETVVIYQWGRVDSGAFEVTPQSWAARSEEDFVRDFKYEWRADVIAPKAGDIFKDEDGEFYILMKDGTIWSVNHGRWDAVRMSGNQIIWGSRDKILTPHHTSTGRRFSDV